MAKVISITEVRETAGRQDSSLQLACEEAASERAKLNSLFTSLEIPDNCTRFRAFPEGYCRTFGLSLEQIHAITDLDIGRLLKLGGSVIELERLTGIYGLDLEKLCLEQNDRPLEDLLLMLARE